MTTAQTQTRCRYCGLTIVRHAGSTGGYRHRVENASGLDPLAVEWLFCLGDDGEHMRDADGFECIARPETLEHPLTTAALIAEIDAAAGAND